MAVRSGDDGHVCLRLLQRLASARRAIIGIYFPPIPWPMTSMCAAETVTCFTCMMLFRRGRKLCCQFTSTDTSDFTQHSLQFWPVIFTKNIWIEAIKWWTPTFGIYIWLISCTIRINRKFPLSSWTDIEESVTLGYDDGRGPIIWQFCKTAYFLWDVIIIHNYCSWNVLYEFV